ncbi:MATE family efflux transporter [Tropicimonas sp. IMCC6043]|uniref:MATE family efflux transporter n=1 Tax=Tropicimonas sp. IMCC6043 TaxID=2510645 RepID=UPI00101BCB4E|nr:MATE family efflux transporter [Tropicimonas sp. IMCC6043]RYH07608.1 MATE family efflux transporter [Tropicimonas sp. IMCC6043]
MSDLPAAFLTGSLTRHIIVMSLTSAVGLVAIFLVDVVDMLFISMLGVEELAAAVGFAGTVLFLTTSICIGMAIAGGALVARALGEGFTDRASEVLTHVMIVGVVFAIAFATLILVNLEDLTRLIGARDETQRLAMSYLTILLPSMPLLMIGIVGSAALRSHGAGRLSMQVTLVAGVVNAALDPIFIFVFGWDLDGAAAASVVSRFALAATALWHLQTRFGGLSRLDPAALARDLKTIAAIAVPAMLSNIAAPIGGAYVVRAVAEFGEAAVAGMAIVGRITPIAFALIFAMSGAIGPIIGQNFGAGRHHRVRTAFNTSIGLIVVYVVPAVAVLFLARGWIADLFGATGDARELVFLFCGPLSLLWIFNGVIFIGNASYNNLGHPFYSTWVNWGRNTLGIFPFVWAGAQIWGAEGVLIGQMVGGVPVAVASFIIAERLMRRAEVRKISQAPDFAAHRRWFNIVHTRR